MLAIARLSLWGNYSYCLLLFASAVEMLFFCGNFLKHCDLYFTLIVEGVAWNGQPSDMSRKNVVGFQICAVLRSWVNEVVLKVLSFTDDRFVLLDPGDWSELGVCSFNRPCSESTLFEPQLQPADLNKEFVCFRSCLWATSLSLPHLIFFVNFCNFIVSPSMLYKLS